MGNSTDNTLPVRYVGDAGGAANLLGNTRTATRTKYLANGCAIAHQQTQQRRTLQREAGAKGNYMHKQYSTFRKGTLHTPCLDGRVQNEPANGAQNMPACTKKTKLGNQQRKLKDCMQRGRGQAQTPNEAQQQSCLLYTSDAADE